MKLSLKAGALRDAVAVAGKAVAAKAVKPVLTGLHLSAADDTLTVTGTDLDVSVRTAVSGVQVKQSGAVVVEAKKLAQILGTLHPDDDVDLTGFSDSLKVRQNGAKFEVPVWDADEFPLPAGFDGAESPWDIGGGELAAAVAAVRWAAAKKESSARFTYHGVLFEFTPGTLTCVATDTKALAVRHAVLTGDGKGELLVPHKGLDALNTMSGEERVQLAVSGGTLLAKDGRTLVACRTLDGRFPPYRAILPKSHVHEFELPLDLFERKVRQARVSTDDESCRVDFQFQPGKAVLTARSAGGGTSEVEMPLPEYAGAEWKTAIDPDYLLGFVGAATKSGADKATLKAASGTGGMVFDAGEHCLCLIMSMGE